MSKRLFTALSVVLSMLHSCQYEQIVEENQGRMSESPQQVSFKVSMVPPSKSSLMPDEDVIHRVSVYAYESGELAAFSSGEDVMELKLDLVSGHVYEVYALANMPDCPQPQIQYEDDFRSKVFEIDVFSSLDDVVPMSWASSVSVGPGTTEVEMSLERLVAKIDFSIEKGLLDYMQVRSVRLRQCPSVLQPFRAGGSRADSKDDVVDGDYASGSDIETLNSGGTIRLYSLENCQGLLLPSNQDPWLKIPERMHDGKADCCTYLEVGCSFPESDEYGVYCGDVTYRFFIGEDSTSDFTVRRNTIQNLSLVTTEEGLGRISWRVDASDLVFRGGTVTGGFVDNFHAPDDFYVSEYVYFEFDMDESADAYWNDNRYDIVGLDKTGELIMDFAGITGHGEGSYSCIGKALKAGDFDVYLLNEHGNKVMCLYEGGRVKMPGVVIGNGERYVEDEKVMNLDEDAEYYINGAGTDLYLYLVDENGYNVNQYEGCDCSMFEWNLDMKVPGGYADSRFLEVGEIRGGGQAGGSFVAAIPVKVKNDGRSADVNKILSGMLGRGKCTFSVSEASNGISTSHKASVYADDISVELRPSGSYESTLGTEMAYYVDNKSMLPLVVKGWKVNNSKDPGVTSYYSAAAEAIAGKVECLSLFCDVMSLWPAEYPLYYSRLPVVHCSFESSGSNYVFTGDGYYFPADDSGVTDSYLRYMIEADRRPLPAGGYEYRTVNEIYRAIDARLLYSSPEPPEINSTIASGYGTLVPVETSLNRDPVRVRMYINENYQLVAVASEPVILEIDVYGTLSSHIRTVSGNDVFLVIPPDIKYYKHEHEFSSGACEYELSQNPTVVDCSAIKDVLGHIRTIEYYSVYDGISAREVLKPYKMTLNVDIFSMDAVPVAVSFPDKLSYDYKNINYTYGEPPSTFNWKDKDSPDAEAFVDDMVHLGFRVGQNFVPELNMVVML